MASTEQILDELSAGNTRFQQGTTSPKRWEGPEAFRVQKPKAIVLGCSDSRVPIEMVFDQGPGDLFIVRVAGNIAAPSQIGSIEFAVTQFDVSLIIVLGHTRCGAINASVQALQDGTAGISDNLRSIVDRIGPNIHHLVDAKAAPPSSLSNQCMIANVLASVKNVEQASVSLQQRATQGLLTICGAYYDLDDGGVHFLSDP
jgi:carbonic anhydrase